MMDTYCWTHGTYTIRELHRNEAKASVPHHSVGFFDPAKHEKIFYRYYQWVPLVLGLTAVAFYIPRYFWKVCEGNLRRHILKVFIFLFTYYLYLVCTIDCNFRRSDVQIMP